MNANLVHVLCEQKKIQIDLLPIGLYARFAQCRFIVQTTTGILLEFVFMCAGV